MLKLKQIASNMTVVTTANADVLFSYSTPVAGNSDEIGLFKTDTWYSSTTSRHINKYFRDVWNADPDTVKAIPQEQIEALIK